MKCECCLTWTSNIEKVNAPIFNMAARSGFLWQYEGKPFEFCPWCGNKLVPDSTPAKDGERA